MAHYISLVDPVHLGSFLLAVIIAFTEEVEARLGVDLKTAGPVERFLSFMQSTVKIDEITWNIQALFVKGSIKAKIKDNPTFRGKLQEGIQDSVEKFVTEARNFVSGLVDLVRQERGNQEMRVLCIFDSLERIQGIGEQAKRVFDSVENLFNAHRDKLRFDLLDTIYSVPPHLGAVLQDGTHMYLLPMVHVFSKPLPGQHGEVVSEGIDKMIEVVDRRSDTWCEWISTEGMRELARASGGDIREMFSLARRVLNMLDVDNDSDFPAPEEVIEYCKKLRINDFGTIPNDEMSWLKSVIASHRHEMKTYETLGTFARLLDGKLILRYRNGDDWYDVHPLLWSRVDAYANAG
jgi:hypothetical protein